MNQIEKENILDKIDGYVINTPRRIPQVQFELARQELIEHLEKQIKVANEVKFLDYVYHKKKS